MLFPFEHALFSALDLLRRYFPFWKLITLESQHANFQTTITSHASSRSMNYSVFLENLAGCGSG